MHHGATLNSISARNRHHLAKKGEKKKKSKKKTTAGPTKKRFCWGCLGSNAEEAVGYSAQKPKRCCFGRGGGWYLEACPFKCCWRLFLGHLLKIHIGISLFLSESSLYILLTQLCFTCPWQLNNKTSEVSRPHALLMSIFSPLRCGTIGFSQPLIFYRSQGNEQVWRKNAA